jgi:site-specific DNA-methyltransferase (adenine-specific)
MNKENENMETGTSTAITANPSYAQPNICLYNADNKDVMANLEDESVDVILTDPPYLYLKNQKLEREFDERHFFSECKRVLTKNGFIVLFGRGTSFYRWNTILDDLGFTFKEEIIWNKSHCTSPLMNLSRVHETISIFTKWKGTINKVKVPYLEMKSHDLDSIINDIKRLKTTFKNTKSLDAVLEFLENNYSESNLKKVHKHIVNQSPQVKNIDRSVSVMQSINQGLNEKSIIRTDRYDSGTFTKFGVNSDERQKGDRCVDVIQGVCFGMNEKSIMKQVGNHYRAIHPTEKPVRLLERLLALVIPKDKPREEITVLDPFGGSFSTMEAVYNMGMKGISCEVDEEYYSLGKQRIENLPPIQTNLFD